MFQSILGFVMDLGLIYLLTATFIILDLLLLSMRVRRLRDEKTNTDRDEREVRRNADAAQQRKAFEQRQDNLKPAQ